MDNITQVERLDVLSKPSMNITKTEEGWLKGTLVATHPGIFKYRNKDGSFREEIRLDVDVFDPVSMQSALGVPITNDHPPKLINANETLAFTVGSILSEARQDNSDAVTDFIIYDPYTIADIENGKRAISVGYRCDVIEEAGKLYQKNIRWNHVAVVKNGRAARASIRMDADAIHYDNEDLYIGEEEEKDKENVMSDNMKTVRLDDGGEYQAEAQVIAQLQEKVARLDELESVQKALVSEKDTLLAERDSMKERLDSAMAELDEIKLAKVQAELEAKHTALVATAKEIGCDKLDGSDEEIMKSVILMKFPKAELADKSQDYVFARFDSALDLLRAEKAEADDAAVRLASGVEHRDSTDDKVIDLEKSKKKYLAHLNGKEIK